MLGFDVCFCLFVLYAALLLQLVCVCICFACIVRILHMFAVCGANPQKGVRRLDSFKVNGW